MTVASGVVWPGNVTVTVWPASGTSGVNPPEVGPVSWLTVPEITSSPALAVVVSMGGARLLTVSVSRPPVSLAGLSGVEVSVAVPVESVTTCAIWPRGRVTMYVKVCAAPGSSRVMVELKSLPFGPALTMLPPGPGPV